MIAGPIKKCPKCGTLTEIPPALGFGLCPECGARVEWIDNGPTNLTEVIL